MEDGDKESYADPEERGETAVMVTVLVRCYDVVFVGRS